MRLLYSAVDQRVPGTTGGSIHVRALAEGLAALGHEVHVLATPGPGGFPDGLVRWHAVAPPFGTPRLRLTATRRATAIARALRPDLVVERYHNFGGEGMIAARRIGAAAVLEVNAPVIDYPGSTKRLLDRCLLVEPMRRWRDWQCRVADLVVTPSAAILPDWLARDKVLEVEWGGDTDRFRPGVPPDPEIVRAPGETLAVFAGAFRSWHGAIHLVEAIAELRRRGMGSIGAVFAGDGPERPRVEAAAKTVTGVRLLGAVAHDRMPAVLSACDIGVAPFDTGQHAPLSLGFYWSPLKVFEYMAAGLPVAAPAIDRLATIVGHGREGLLYDPGRPGALADALVELADPDRRRALGAAARERAVRNYSWTVHCAALDGAFRRLCQRAG